MVKVLLVISILLSQQPIDDANGLFSSNQPAREEFLGAIRGLVLADALQPLSGAAVAVSGAGVKAVLLTDTDGRFETRNLPCGEYTVTSQKTGYTINTAARSVRLMLSTDHPHGQVEFRMSRAAAVTGRLLFENREPAIGVRVTARCRHDSLPTTSTATGDADDRGTFRIWGLRPGGCVVQARVALSTSTVRPAGPGEAVPTDAVGASYPSAAGADGELLALRAGDDVSIGDLVLAGSRPLPVGAGEVGETNVVLGLLRGQVSDADTASSLSFAEVAVTNLASNLIRHVTADAEGRFEIALREGSYVLDAHRNGYLAASPGGGVMAKIVAPETNTVVIRLAQAGVIDGHVFLPSGDSLPGAIVRLYKKTYLLGKSRPVIVDGKQFRADDRGHFRAYGLSPGSYFVSASFGAHDVMALGAKGVQDQFSPVFFPGVTTIGDAVAVTATGKGSGDISFVWTPSTGGGIEGIVVAVDGTPAGRSVVAAVPSVKSSLPLDSGSYATADAVGRFRFVGLPDGLYQVRAIRGNPMEDHDAEFGSTAVQVSQGSTQSIAVRTQRGMTIRGVVVDKGTQATPATNGRFLVTAFPADFDLVPLEASMPSAKADAKGAFEIKNVWGPVVVRVECPAGYYMRAVSSGGHEITDTPRLFVEDDGPIGPVQVEVTTQYLELAGKATDDEGMPVRGKWFVVAFPSRMPGQPQWSRYIALVPGRADGSFSHRGLPAGEYLVFAISEPPHGALEDPGWLESHRSRAQRVELSEDSKQMITLKVMRQ